MYRPLFVDRVVECVCPDALENSRDSLTFRTMSLITQAGVRCLARSASAVPNDDFEMTLPMGGLRAALGQLVLVP